MSTGKMHADEVDTSVALVARLLTTQFPQWSHLPIQPVPSTGTDNALYRLGDDMIVRLPRVPWAVWQVNKEHQWLPKLAPHLPLPIPVLLAKGTPGEGYPWNWSITPWFEGETATIDQLADLHQAAIDLAQFIVALRQIDPSNGPLPGEHNSGRGVPLLQRDDPTRTAIQALHGMLDTHAVTEVWEAALQAPAWQSPLVWIHGDVSPGNLIAYQGRLNAVIDFGCLGIGDPACDLMIGWTLFSGESRDAFRATLAVDEATWARGRGWALSWALIFIPYYLKTNPAGVSNAWHTIDEVLADYRANG